MNKLLLTYTSFRRPVFLTLCHMVACVAMSGLGDVTGIIHKQQVRTRQQVRCGPARVWGLGIGVWGLGFGVWAAVMPTICLDCSG